MPAFKPPRPGEVSIPEPVAPDARLVFIGRIHTPWATPADCPKNSRERAEVTATLEVDEPYVKGLKDIGLYSHLIVLYWLDRSRRDLIVQAPSHVPEPRGVFALRSPVRPNPIGVSVVELVAVEGNTLTIAPALMREVLDTNTIGPLITAQAFMPGMIERNYGRVVMVSSVSGQRASQRGHWPAYHLSKFALNGLTLQLASLTSGTDVLVNAMCPGWVHSDMGGPSAPRTPAQGADTAVWLATLPGGGPNGGFFQDRQPLDW